MRNLRLSHIEVEPSLEGSHEMRCRMSTVAFLGLGTMGAPMATRLAARHDLAVWNRTRAKAEAISGATVAETPAAAVAGADVVITMLATPAAVESVLFGADGVVAALRPGACLVEMSTIGPHAVADIARRLPDGIGLVDAPVGGSVDKATDGTLTLFAGGTDADVDRVAPVLAALGTLLRCGGSGAGAAAKLVVNTALIAGVTLLDEVLTLAGQLDVPAELADQILGAGPLAALLTRAKATATSQFTADLAVKDLALTVEHAKGDLPHTTAALNRLRAAALTLGDKDFAALAPTHSSP
jgi:3-hydroxyisobutyrate dehydrogenase-like beta-hydroxyacid dehydrogenase